MNRTIITDRLDRRAVLVASAISFAAALAHSNWG